MLVHETLPLEQEPAAFSQAPDGTGQAEPGAFGSVGDIRQNGRKECPYPGETGLCNTLGCRMECIRGLGRLPLQALGAAGTEAPSQHS